MRICIYGRNKRRISVDTHNEDAGVWRNFQTYTYGATLVKRESFCSQRTFYLTL